jgi:hypothetical protein
MIATATPVANTASLFPLINLSSLIRTKDLKALLGTKRMPVLRSLPGKCRYSINRRELKSIARARFNTMNASVTGAIILGKRGKAVKNASRCCKKSRNR